MPGLTIRNANQRPRSLEFGLFVTGCLWAAVAQAAAKLASRVLTLRLGIFAGTPLFHAAIWLTLLLLGFTLIRWIAFHGGSVREVNALPARKTALREWLIGAAFGWAMLLLAVTPILLARDFQPSFWLAPRAWALAALALLTLSLWTLALEVVFRGFLYTQLTRAAGTTAATIGMSLLYAIAAAFLPYATPISFVVTFAIGLLLCIAVQRTRALWLSWGLHFAFAATMSVVFGLPVAGDATIASVVSTSVSGRDWLTGGFYGPEGAVLTGVIALLLLPLLYSLTRDLAWEYAHDPILPAGYAVIVQPPAAHTAMEEAAVAKPAPLVQILSTTSASASTMPLIEEHLRTTHSEDHSE